MRHFISSCRQHPNCRIEYCILFLRWVTACSIQLGWTSRSISQVVSIYLHFRVCSWNQIYSYRVEHTLTHETTQYFISLSHHSWLLGLGWATWVKDGIIVSWVNLLGYYTSRHCRQCYLTARWSCSRVILSWFQYLVAKWI